MKLLGIDPGLAHTGWAVVVDGKVKARGTIKPPGPRGKRLTCQWLQAVMPELWKVLTAAKVEAVVVEEVVFFGRSRRVTLPLSHMCGAIVASALAFGLPVYLLTPSMKAQIPTSWRGTRNWSEHEKDAAALALAVETADAPSKAKKPSAVERRRITTPGTVPSRR